MQANSKIPADHSRAPIIPQVLRQHAEETALLHEARRSLLEAASFPFSVIRKLDERLAAHLDALSIAGEHAWQFCQEALETPSAGAMFVAAVRVLEERRKGELDGLFALALAAPETRGGLMAALAWSEPQRLHGVVAGILGAAEPALRAMGIDACAAHRVDPGLAAGRIRDPDAMVRARALRAAGELGLVELASVCTEATRDEDPECQFWSAWSAVLLGNRHQALEWLARASLQPGAYRAAALALAVQAMNMTDAHRYLQQLRQEAPRSWLLDGSGIAGNPAYVPWIIGHMDHDPLARLAGRAFTLITGADLEEAAIERTAPTDFKSGPNDDPDDPNVDMDEDDGLAWPDREKCAAWWTTNKHRFHEGVRYFMGAPVTREHCIDVLKNGYQRQRIAAAEYLCLLNPGTPLFNTTAPAWRQQRLLSKIT